MSEPFVSECCEGERCCFEGCSAQAEHKVEETIFHDDPLQIRHELTAYICHEHFRQIMGPAADRAPGRTPRDFRIPAQQPLSTLREALEPCKVEHKKFEEWAVTQHYDMHEHPLHYLFLDTKTYAARMGWKAALDYVTQTLASTNDHPTGNKEGGA